MLLESEKIRGLSFSPTLFTEYEEIKRDTSKNSSSDSTGQNLKYSKETVK